MIDWLGIGHMFELTGMPRDWFYRSMVYAVAGGTVFCLIFSLWAVFSRPKGEIENPLVSLFTWRQRLDDSVCADKYGAEKWAEYQTRVKYRILPGVY